MEKLDVIQQEGFHLLNYRSEYYTIKGQFKVNEPLSLTTETKQYGFIIPTTEEAVKAMWSHKNNLSIKDFVVDSESRLFFAGSEIPNVFLYNSTIVVGNNQDKANKISNSIFINTNLNATKFTQCNIYRCMLINCEFNQKNLSIDLYNNALENIIFDGNAKITKTQLFPDEFDLNKLNNLSKEERSALLTQLQRVIIQNSKKKFLLLSNVELNACRFYIPEFCRKRYNANHKETFEIKNSILSYTELQAGMKFNDVLLKGNCRCVLISSWNVCKRSHAELVVGEINLSRLNYKNYQIFYPATMAKSAKSSQEFFLFLLSKNRNYITFK